jgi:DNA-binding CsgD family transcriptional regulator
MVAVAPLRGRETELARLEELTASTRAGVGGLIVVEGAAGIGKSALLAEAQGRAAAADLLVAAGGADELDQVTPWAPLLHALGSSQPPVLATGELGPLSSLTDQRLAVVERMQAAVEKAAASRPVLIVLDDLQWTDEATLLALGSLPVSLFSYPVGWLLALRPLPARPALELLLERLEETGAARLHLGPLPAADAVALARDTGVTGTDADVGKQIAAAEGNPFYILQLLKAGTGTGSAGGQVPAGAQAAIAQHLRSLSDDARRLLQVASVLGREFSVAEVAVMTGQPSSRLLGAVEEAMRAEILAEVPAGLAFRHDLLRQAVYESLPASARVALHREAAQALRRTGASAVRVAGQLAIGTLPGDEAAIATMQRAVTELAASSPGAAADLALRALELAGERDGRRAQLVLSAVQVLGLAGRSAEARAVFERYLALYRPPAPVEAALQLQLRQAWVFDRLDPYPVPVPGYLLSDPAVDPPTAAALTALEQVPKMWRGQGAEADQALERWMPVVAEGGRADELAVVSRLRVLASLLRGRTGEAVARAKAALDAARPFKALRSSRVHEEMVVTALAADGRIGEALETMRDALAAATEEGRAGLVFRYRRLRAAMLLSQGRLEDAEAEARGVIDLPVKLGYPQRTALPLSVMVETAVRRGDAAEARAALARYSPPVRGVFPDFHWAAALAADPASDAAAAARALAPIRGQLEAGVFFFAAVEHHRLPQLVRIARRAGEDTSARAFARAAAILGEQNPHSETLVAAAAHAQALIDDDPVLLCEAVGRAASGQDRLLEAAAREDLGRMLTARSAAQEAAAQLEAAYDFYVRIGAHHDAARVRAGLRALGIRKRQTSVAKPRHGWASLTRSEQAVVELVAQGLTNRAAASELFLSPDTVNTHLRHAFTKLGIRSRVELARLAAERKQIPS